MSLLARFFQMFFKGVMLLKPERAQLRNLISETVLSLCKNSCVKEFQNLSIEGIIGITFDEEEVVLVSFKDEASISNVGKSIAIHKPPTVAPDHNTEKVTPQLVEEVIVVPTSCEQMVSIANSQPSVRPGAFKRKRLRSFGDQKEKFCPTNYVAGNDPLPDSSIHSSSGYERRSNSDILTDDKSQLKIISSRTLADVDAVVRNASREYSCEQKLQQSLDKVDHEMSKTRRNSAGSNRLISAENETVSFSELGLDVSVKCEETSEDGDCVFIKSEIFELGDNNAFEFACDDGSHAVMSKRRMVNEESLFGDNLLQYSDDFGVEGQSHRSRNNQLFSRHRAKSQYPEYIQLGCDVQVSGVRTYFEF